MCRLILAKGRFSSSAILDAAIMMSSGQTADHEGPTQQHPNGWGAVWRDPGGGLSIHRDPRRINDTADESPLRGVETDLLAVHVRHATLARNQGLQCTHPLARPGAKGPWYLLHNGFLPTVHQRLGKERSEFDSAEYLEYLVPENAHTLDIDAALSKLRAIPPGGTSANAILMNAEWAYVIHWTPQEVPYRRYFSMHQLALEDCTIYASEIIPALAPRERWAPLPQRHIVPIKLNAHGRGLS
ncbi:class II glutamine amidotransferase [Sorangium sp. So ce302]|uniref:class II glutamine amidotransferase n=1 Tax=Sorangium sp. So ce302 TaxID=3133297 RepID=UPI003F641317